MWVPDLNLKPSPNFVLLLVVLHLSVAIALVMLPPVFLILFTLLVVSVCFSVAKSGLMLLNRSVVRVWLEPTGWYLESRNRLKKGPYELASRSHLDTWFVRLSFSSETDNSRHVLVTPAMVGKDVFRQLQVFLRWAPEKNQAPLPRG